jgi:multiple antibiotic resistance protein
VLPSTYIFTILFLAMGPLKTIPVFYMLTREQDWRYRLRAAFYATLIAAAMVALVAFSGVSTIQSWQVSFAALKIAIGVLLIRSTLNTLSTMIAPAGDDRPNGEKPAPASPAAVAFSPLAAPTIVSPTGVVTIVLFLAITQSDRALQYKVDVMLALMLGLNFVCMLLAGYIVRFVRMMTLEIVGWVFAALQAALAVEVILGGLKDAGFTAR